MQAKQAKPAARVAPPPKPEPKKPVAKAPPSPFAFLGGLKVSGVIGSGASAVVMLSAGSEVYVARSGRLYNESGKEVAGVTTALAGKSVTLTGGGQRYSLAVPK